MTHLLRIYRAQFRTTIAIQMQYRVSLVIWLIGLVTEPVVYLVVWTAVARSGGGQVGTYTTSGFAAYFIAVMLVNHATFTWIIYGFDQRIRQGSFSPLLLRPVHPIHNDLADNLTYKMLTFVVIAPAGLILALAFHASFRLVPWALAAFAPALILAMGLRFVVEWTVALTAFWVTRMGAINQMYYIAVLFLSGQVAPLSLFPPPIRLISMVLPFRWMVAFPVDLVLGRLSPGDAVTGVAVQCFWLILSVGFLHLLWRVGLRRYSAVGS